MGSVLDGNTVIQIKGDNAFAHSSLIMESQIKKEMNLPGKSSVLVLVGPRYTGKTTAAKQLLSRHTSGQYVDLIETDPTTYCTESCLVFDNFQPCYQSMVENHIKVARNTGTRMIIVCETLNQLSQPIMSQVDYILRRVVWEPNVWDLNAHNTETNESRIVDIYPENVTLLIKEIERQKAIATQVHSLVCQ